MPDLARSCDQHKSADPAHKSEEDAKIKEKLEAKFGSVLSKHISARQISAITGSIRSQEIVLGQIASLFTRNMNIFIATSPSWDATREISDGVLNELQFWKENAEKLNLKVLDRADSAPAHVTLKVNLDASDHAAGAVLKLGNVTHAVQKTSPSWKRR